MGYAEEIGRRFRREPVFTIQDVRKIFPGASAEYAHLLMHIFILKGRAFRVTNGTYTFHDDSQVVGFAFRPFYYGCQEALSMRGIWEQETNPTVITVRKVRTGLRNFHGGNYIVRRMERKMFFGFEPMKYGDFWVPVSDAEKTLIDMVYFKQPLPNGVLKGFRKKIDRKKLEKYLKKCPARVASRIRKLFP